MIMTRNDWEKHNERAIARFKEAKTIDDVVEGVCNLEGFYGEDRQYVTGGVASDLREAIVADAESHKNRNIISKLLREDTCKNMRKVLSEFFKGIEEATAYKVDEKMYDRCFNMCVKIYRKRQKGRFLDALSGEKENDRW